MTPDPSLLNYLTFEGTDDNWTSVLSPEPWPQYYQVIACGRDHGRVNNYKHFYRRTALGTIRDRMASAGIKEALDVGPGTWDHSIVLSTQLICSGGQFMPTVRIEDGKIYLNWDHADFTG